MRESWLDDIMHVLEEEELGRDVSMVDAALKRNEAISTDVKSRVSGSNLVIIRIML